MTDTSTRHFIYRIDRQDRLTYLNEESLDFARENGAPELTEKSVLGRPLWDFIAGEGVKHIYQILFARVRERIIVPPLPFRCDSPNLRRFMTLTLHPLDDGQIELEGVLVREEARDEVKFIDCAAPHSADALMMCTWCKRVEVSPDHWVEIEEAISELNLFAPLASPLLAHGVCPGCSNEMQPQ